MQGSVSIVSDDLISLGALSKVAENLVISGCPNLRDVGELSEVGYLLILRDCGQLISLGNLRKVGGSLIARNCVQLRTIPSLLKIGNTLDIGNCPLLRGVPQDIEYKEVYPSEDLLIRFSNKEFLQRLQHYSSLPAHEALCAQEEVKKTPFFKDVLLETLKRG